MTDTSRAAYWLAAFFVVFGLPLPSAPAREDAFESFKTLGHPVTAPEANAFSALSGSRSSMAVGDLLMEAKLTPEGQVMQEGLVWRVFSPQTGLDGRLPLVATASGGVARFHLAPGDYFVNCAFGRAGVTMKVTITASGTPQRQTIVLDAGGFVFNAVAGTDQRIASGDLRFSIFSAEMDDDGERPLVMDDVKPGTIVGLSAGTYHVVSEYGDLNAEARADLQVEAGKLTQVVMQHRAARIALKLVSQQGGEAVADTAWSVVTASGEIVGESVSAFTTMVLSEGEYFAVARNKNKIYQRPFTVRAGRDIEVEVLMREAPDLAGSLRGPLDGD